VDKSASVPNNPDRRRRDSFSRAAVNSTSIQGNNMETGTLTRWFNERGFGFISPDNGDP
jgi:hypothetical protein